MRLSFWLIANLFGYFFAKRFLAPVYRIIINLSLHGLGYGNGYKDSWTGEEWFVRKILATTKPRVCLDIGANVGKYTRLLLKYTEAKIYAIEPSLYAFTKLQEGDRVIKIHTAISDVNGSATLYSGREGSPKASLDKRVNPGKGEIVKTLTIQTFIKEHDIKDIDFIKIDTEGYEREVLKGLGDLRPRIIQFEFNVLHLYRDYTLLSITQLLPEYEFYRLLPRDMVKIDPKQFLNNVFMFCNIIAIKK